MVRDWKVPPCGTWPDPYRRIDVGLLRRFDRNDGDRFESLVQIDVRSPSLIVSQTTTDERPPYVRTYPVERIAKAFGVPLEMLRQTTTEAN